MQTPFILTSSASKPLPFKIIDEIKTDFKIRTMSIYIKNEMIYKSLVE